MTTFPPPPPGPSLDLSYAGQTDVGRQREENEDAFMLATESRLFIVADGMGGRAGGAVAAQLATTELARFFREQHAAPRSPWPFDIDKSESLGINLIRVGIKVANREIRTAAAADPRFGRMGTTVAALAVGETQIVLGHVGDVRIYRLRGRALERLTRDHSVVEELRAARPDISDEEVARFARSVVTRALGTREEVDPTVATAPLEPGDLYLLCSDGLWSLVPDEVLEAILTSTNDLDHIVQVLCATANEAGGTDNITAVVVRVG